MPALRGKFGPRGPIVDAQIGVSVPQQKWMRARGMHVPPPITVQLLVDTGADTTTIAEIHMRSLQIESTGKSPVRTITTDVSGQTCLTYPASLRIVSPNFGDKAHEIGAIEVLGREFHNEGIDGLLGRDVIGTLQLTIDGPRRWFVLEWP